MKLKRIENLLAIATILLISVAILMTAFIDDPINETWLEQAKSVEASTVLLNNAQLTLPLNDLDDRTIASVNIGSAYSSTFDSLLKKYAYITSFKLYNTNLQLSIDSLNNNLKFFNTVIVQVTDATLNDAPVQAFLNEIYKLKQLVVVAYGNPNSLQFLDKVNCPIIWTPKNDPVSAAYVAQAVFGGVALGSKLPVDISSIYKKGAGYKTTVSRLKYTTPEDAGVNKNDLEKPIDRIVNEAITKKATPGAVVMVVKDGKVIFNKAYGNHTYDNGTPEKVDDIFDLASVTKIAATTMATMRLYEQQKLKLDTNVGAYIPLARNTSKNNLRVKELLLHQAGLIPYIPFFERLTQQDYRRDSSASHPLKVADNYYLRANYFENVMWPEMLNSRIANRGKYIYSDVSMYLMKDIIERLASERLDKYMSDQFYNPLGMYTAGFNPRSRFEKSKIVPTEQDDKFRKTLLEGYVHDQGAAMAGGVSGHAGLFSTANDMAILFQMVLNGGKYGGKQYFKKGTIDLFTARYSNVSRRGLGFDRWDPDRSNRYPSDLASDKTYGHTGYTGTCVWVDPEYNLIYIFLSNRVHPQVSGKLTSLRIRPRIQDAIYQAIKKASPKASSPKGENLADVMP